MKKIFIFLLIAIAASTLYFFTKTKDGEPSGPTEHSGAYEALNFLAAQRVYPFDKIPETAHFAAWEYVQRTMLGGSRNNSAPWESMGPHNISGRTLALEFNPQNPNTIYAGSASGGLWRSYTGGLGPQAWEQVATGFPILGVSTIAFTPGDSTTLYIGTGEVYNYEAAGTGAAYRNTRGSYGMGILKSTDGGQSWTLSLDWSYNQERGIWMVKVSPQDPELVWAATTEGVYKSTDAGASWQQMHDVVMATDLLIHPDDPDQVVACHGNFSSPGFGIYKTTDGGESWNKITSDLPDQFNGKIQLGMAPSDPGIIYASIGNGFGFNDGASWLCRSDDFGDNWTVQTQQDYSQWQGWFAHDVAVSPTNPDELIVIGINGYKSIDAGEHIDFVSSGVHVDCHDVTYHPTDGNIVYIVSDGGVFRSDDAGESFQDANDGYQTVQFYNGFSNSFQDSTFCIGGLQDNGTIRWNSDLTWTWFSGGDGSWTATGATNDDIYYASSQFLNIRRTDNGGNNFTGVAPPNNNEPTVFIAPYVIAQDNPMRIYAGRSRVYFSLTGGNVWFPTNANNPLDGNPILSMAISAQNGQVVYTATAPLVTGPGVFVTTNGGTNWTNITGDLPDRFPMDLTVDPTDEATAYITYSGFGTGHVFKTTDYGENWTDMTNNLPDVPTNTIVVDPLIPANIYVGNDLGVFASTNGGQTWQVYMDGLPEAAMVFDLIISPANRKLRAATHGNGAYQRDLLDEEIVAVKDPVLADQSVKVFPNPLRETGTIQYELLKKERVQIRLVDGAGRMVRNLFEGIQPEGRRQLTVDRAGLPAGTYYCRLKAGEMTVTKKLVVL